MKFWIVILLSVFAQIRPAHALIEVPTLRFALGYSMLKMTALNPSQVPVIASGTSIGAIATINPSFLWDIPQVRSRAGLHFQADLGSKYGFVPLIGIGLDYIFYPLGLSSSREVKDDDSIVIKTRVSPFLQMRLTPVKASITQPSADPLTAVANSDFFKVDMIEFSIGAGVDYPMSDRYTFFGGLNYRFAGFTSEETTQGRFSYSGIALLVGVQTNFY